MKRLRLLGLTALAMFVFGAVAATVANAAELEPLGPALLLLNEEKVTELEFKGSGKATKIQTVGGKTIECTAVKVTANGFKEIPTGHPADANLGLGDIDFTGCKQLKVACRSENTAGEKDPIETILVKAELHLAAEKSTGGELEPILIANVFGVDGKTLIINCPPVKEEVKGKLALLITPGLTEVAAGGTFTIASKQKEGKAVTGTCTEVKEFCEGLTKEPLLGNLGAGFEGAGEEFEVTGSFNKMVFIDD